jgi:hypothetical protein
MPDTRESTVQLLVDVEQQLEAVDSGLREADPAALQAACVELRRAALDFAAVLEAALSAEVFDVPFRGRVEAVAQRLALQRESLARRNVVVERALASIMRRHAGPTYSIPGRAQALGIH